MSHRFDDQLISPKSSAKKQPTSTARPFADRLTPQRCVVVSPLLVRTDTHMDTRRHTHAPEHTYTHATSTTCCCWPRSAVIRTLTPSLHQQECSPFGPPLSTAELCRAYLTAPDLKRRPVDDDLRNGD